MAKELVLVGAGNYFTELAKDSFTELQKKGIIGNVYTVDVKSHGDSAFNLVRQPDEPLSSFIDDVVQEKSPLVILAHPNDLHAPEALELVKNAKSQPKVLIEKPYALVPSELAELRTFLGTDTSQIGLLEYYLMMKGIPLQVAAGTIKEDSFYFQPGALKSLVEGKTAKDFVGAIGAIGRPMYIVAECIEGEGNYGKLEHRHKSLVDSRLGGGMIQDLGHHTLTPLMGLAKIIGHITPASISGIRTAYAEEYVQMAKEKFGIPIEHVGESYVEMDLETSQGIPIRAAWGKYIEKEGTEKGVNQRRIIIVGTRGSVLYDMTNNILAIQKGDDVKSVVPLLQADKSGAKYQSVMRAAIETISGNNPFRFDPFDIGLTAQDIVFKALELSHDQHDPKNRVYHRAGVFHDTIFR